MRPLGIATSDTHVAIADFLNHRVLLYNSHPTSNNQAADVVVGQSNFTDSTFDCAANRLRGAYGATIVGTKLIVADTNNHRVLIWNEIPTSDGQAADIVIGQSDFTSCTANAGGAPSGVGFVEPTSIWSDGERLIVADGENARVLIWNTFPTSNGVAADLVLGQTDFTSVTDNAGLPISDMGFGYPSAVVSNGVQIFVADGNNHRVLVWNSFPTTNGQSADVVLGQADFTSNAGATTQEGLSGPYGIFLAEDLLFVGDSNNNRVIAYKSN